MFWFKKQEEVETPKERKKIYYSDIPVGSVLVKDNHSERYFYQQYKYEKVEEKMTKYGGLRQKVYCYYIGEPFPISKVLDIDKFIHYDDISTLGLDFCKQNKIFTYIDVDWVKTMEKLDKANSIKELKEILKETL